jgi:hypothetical protein
MPWGVMILPLLGGYLFLNWCRVSRYFIRKDDRERLIFGSAFVGLFFLLIARVLVVWLADTWPVLYDWKTLLADIPYLGAASLALVIGVLLPWPINQLISRDREIRAIIRLSDDPLERLFHVAELEGRQVLVTLKNNKVYTGPALSCPMALSRPRAHVEIAPYISGYRDPDTHNLVLDTFYTEAIKSLQNETEAPSWLDERDFRKVIPVENIMTLGFFDPRAYLKFGEMNDAAHE